MTHSSPICPPDVPQDVAAEFDRLVSLLGDRATQSDEITLLMLASSWTTWRRAMSEVHALGNVVMSGGTAIANPSLAVAHQAHGQILALCKELGLTARTRKRSKPAASTAAPRGLQLLAPPTSTKTGA